MAELVDVGALAGKVFDGGWRRSAGGSLTVTSPASGEKLATVGLADVTDIRAAVGSAAEAQPGWAATAPATRAAVLRRAATLLEQHHAEVESWLIREAGSIRAKARAEVADSALELWEAAAQAVQPYGQLLPSNPGRQSIARRVPLGVVAVISPWNVPLLLAMRAVAPALALGNAVVLKPDVKTAVAGGLVVARLFEEAGLPQGVLQVLPGDAEPGAALVEAPGVDMIAFTGSTEVGRQVAESAGRRLVRTSLELGGNNALIVLDDADLDAASSAGAFGAFFHQGQVCMAASRHIVQESVAEAYVQRLVARAEKLTVGDPWTDDVALGPLISADQVDRMRAIVARTLAAGAVLRTGGTGEGLFYRPTVLTGVTDTMPAFTEEIFGPVAPVIVVRDDDEAVAVANRTEYGLVAAVQTGSVARGLALADRLATGMVHVNDPIINDEAAAPFGGRGASGNGSRHGALHSWDQFTQWHWLTVRDTPATLPF